MLHPSAIKSPTQDSAQRNNQTRSPNHCCREKTMSIKCSVWVCVCVCVCVLALVIRHANQHFFLRRIIVPSVAFQPLPYFSALPYKLPDFQGQKKLNTKYKRWYCLQLLSATLLILRIHRYIKYRTRYSSQISTRLSWFSRQIFEISSIIRSAEYGDWGCKGKDLAKSLYSLL